MIKQTSKINVVHCDSIIMRS